MAVTPPVPPVPPVAPVPPAVSLGDGGSVHEGGSPQSGHTTGEEQQESQARSAVANGEGALGKTTVTDPKAQIGQESGQTNGQSMGTTQATKRSSTQIVQDGQVQQALADGAGQNGQQQNVQAGQKSQTQQPPAPKSYTNYSGVFWAATAVFLLAFAVFLVKRVLLRQQGAEGLKLTELFRTGRPQERAEQPKEKPPAKEERQEEILTEYTGMRPDEVLAKLSREAVVPRQNLSAYAGQKPAEKKKKAKPKKNTAVASPDGNTPESHLPKKPLKKTGKGKGPADDGHHFEARV